MLSDLTDILKDLGLPIAENRFRSTISHESGSTKSETEHCKRCSSLIKQLMF